MRKLLMSLAACAVWSGFAAADDDEWGFSYQAVLRDKEGAPVSASGKHEQQVTFRLYSGPNSSTVLWARKYTVYCDDVGLFNVFLTDSEGTAVDGTLTRSLKSVCESRPSQGLYVGLAVGSGDEIGVRQLVGILPYAVAATTTQSLRTAGTDDGVRTDNANLSVEGSLTVKGAANADDGFVVGKNSGGILPQGAIVLWNDKSKAPDGSAWDSTGLSADKHWAICNGNNSTPNLSNRFVMGVGNGHSRTETGGSNTVTLANAQLPKHTHLYSCLLDVAICSGTGSYGSAYPDPNVLGNGGWTAGKYLLVGKNDSHEFRNDYHRVGAKTATTGDGGGHENRPPYLAVVFIMRK